MKDATQTAVFGGGCFWCIEAVYKEIKGVTKVTSGYAGGHVANPDYYLVASKTTGHAEVIKVEFDPAMVSYRDLLEVFFSVHDPTQLNRQGHDTGPEYRSIILYTTDEQRAQAEAIIQQLQNDHVYDQPIITEVKPLDTFYEAEPEHQDFYNRNPNSAYCHIVINPKLKKFKEKFTSLLKQ